MVMRMTWRILHSCYLVFLLGLFSSSPIAFGQTPEKAIIAHTSESISLAPLLYGIEKGFYRREGVDLDFRILRTDLASAAMVGSREVDYKYSFLSDEPAQPKIDSRT